MSGLNEFLLHEVEMPLIEVTADLEDTGYAVNVAHFERLAAELDIKKTELLCELRAIAGALFNPQSPKQVAELLFGKLQLPVLSRTDSGRPSTDKRTLQRLAEQDDTPGLLLDYRKVQKVAGTYCNIPEKVDVDGRLHVSFNQLGAKTGRFTSGSVIQTMPKDDTYQLRRGFVAPTGSKIVAADFQQQELRILAGVSGDENMTQAISDGVDLHGLAAVRVFELGCDPDEVAEKHAAKRNQVKAVQFGIIYGRSSTSLASELDLEPDAARKLVDTYFEEFRGVKSLIDETHQRAARDGFIDDVFGRRRYLPNAMLTRPNKHYDRMSDSEKETLRRFNAARRAAQNFVIQAAGATITKLAMLRCHAAIRDRYPQVEMILTLHDELQFEVPDEQVELFAAELPELMCNLGLERFGLTVPLAVDVKVGPSWGELSPWEGAADAAA